MSNNCTIHSVFKHTQNISQYRAYPGFYKVNLNRHARVGTTQGMFSAVCSEAGDQSQKFRNVALNSS